MADDFRVQPLPRRETLERMKALPGDVRTVLALAAAQRMVQRESPVDAQLTAALDAGWLSLDQGPTLPPHLAAEIEGRPDLDDDAVAATYYAVDSLRGDSQSAYWAVSRLVDAAFARVPYPPGSSTFRPVDEDARSSEVQHELSWLVRAIDIFQQQGVGPDSVRQLRNLR